MPKKRLVSQNKKWKRIYKMVDLTEIPYPEPFEDPEVVWCGLYRVNPPIEEGKEDVFASISSSIKECWITEPLGDPAHLGRHSRILLTFRRDPPSALSCPSYMIYPMAMIRRPNSRRSYQQKNLYLKNMWAYGMSGRLYKAWLRHEHRKALRFFHDEERRRNPPIAKRESKPYTIRILGPTRHKIEPFKETSKEVSRKHAKYYSF